MKFVSNKDKITVLEKLWNHPCVLSYLIDDLGKNLSGDEIKDIAMEWYDENTEGFEDIVKTIQLFYNLFKPGEIHVKYVGGDEYGFKMDIRNFNFCYHGYDDGSYLLFTNIEFNYEV